MLTSFKHSSARNLRCFATFVDPFGAKGQGDVNEGELYEHNALVGYTKMIGDPKKGLADDTRCALSRTLGLKNGAVCIRLGI